MEAKPEFILAGVLMKQHYSGRDTGGLFSLFENTSTGPSKTPIHVHADDDETIYVLTGTLKAIVAGEEHFVDAGESIFLPRNIAHQLMNVGEALAHYLLICTPSGFEGFLAEGAHLRKPGEEPMPPSAEEIERMKAAAPRFGIKILPSW